MPARYGRFAIPLPLYREFEYRLDPADAAEPGARYRLTFAGRELSGILTDVHEQAEFDAERIRPVQERLDAEPLLDAHLLALARWIADYYLQPPGEAIYQCLPGYLRGTRGAAPTRVKCYRLCAADPSMLEALRRRSPRQHELCMALAGRPEGMDAADLKAVNPNWHAVVRALEKKALVQWSWRDAVPWRRPDAAWPTLADEQRRAVDGIEAALDRFGVHLLDGITGSGKTEIYLRLMDRLLGDGGQVIYLVPEIGLTPQLCERVGDRFGDCVALSHSGLSELQRYRAWDRFRRGEARIMLGTRSSLFARCARLALIVIDEEHDHSYRQQDGLRYHARDLAIKRAQMLGIPVVLGSATPSLESLNNCRRDSWHHYRLDRRPTRYPPPPPRVIDVRNSRFQHGCAAPTLRRIERHLERGGQVLIYLNRRGFAPVVMCVECGWQAQCHQCDARLTLHQSVRAMLCHHCGRGEPVPDECPECGHDEIRHFGIGTEQLEQGLRQRFDPLPVLRIDRDVASSREALRARLEQLRGGEPCILIGTQMIAKGHDYPAITLAVILDADQALFSASYRASEQLAQTLFQVAGRAGRGDREGEAVVQTAFADAPLMRALASRDYRQIAADLLDERRRLGFPPFARVVMFRADAARLEPALELLGRFRELIAATARADAVQCIGPIPALMTRRVGRYRGQLCLLSRDYPGLRAVLRESLPAIADLPVAAGVGWSVDVDAFDL